MTPAERLAQARAALHKLLIGESLVAITDQNGERVEYRPADAKRLAAYVDQLAGEVEGRTRPHTIRFQTSKGL
jgi:hypothetical protein